MTRSGTLFSRPSRGGRTHGVVGLLLAATVLALVAGCGFQLRADAQLPFSNAVVQANSASRLAPMLRRALAAQQKLAASDQDAGLVIQVENERHTKDILSLSGGGKVREFRLVYSVILNVTDRSGTRLIEPLVLRQVRDLTYSETATLAKEAEEVAAMRSMEDEVLRQALRRLAYVKR